MGVGGSGGGGVAPQVPRMLLLLVKPVLSMSTGVKRLNEGGSSTQICPSRELPKVGGNKIVRLCTNL